MSTIDSRTPVQQRPGYSAALDGVRGVFVAGFIAYHLGATFLEGMWFAINLFFVISGFLITRILIEERERWGRFMLLRFYVGRARRLLPALLALLTVVTGYGLFFAPEEQRHAIGGDVLATLFYVMNWRLVAENDPYFFDDNTPSLLRHAWTLSIEEQFYLLAPFLLILLFLLRRAWQRVAVVLALWAALTVWTAHLGFTDLGDAPRLYFGTDTRMPSLLAGVALGLGLQVRFFRPSTLPSQRVLWWAGMAGIVLTAPALFVGPYTPWMWNLGGAAVFSLTACGLIALCADPRPNPVQRVLTVRPLPWLGRRTYALYVWHWPVALLVTRMPFGPPLLRGLVGFAVVVLIAHLSHTYLERPVYRRGIRGLLPRTRMPVVWALVPVLVLAVLAQEVLRGYPPRAEQTAFTLPDGSRYVPTDETAPRDLVGGQARWNGQPTRIAVYGDSVPDFLLARFPQGAFPGAHLTPLAVPGCDLLDEPVLYDGDKSLPNPAECTTLKNSWATRVAADRAEVLMLFVSGYAGARHDLPGARGAWIADAAGQRAVTDRLTALHDAALAAGVKQVQLVTLPCREAVTSGNGVPADAARLVTGDPEVFDAYARPLQLNQLLRDWAARHPDTTRVLDLAAVQCPDGRRLDTLGGVRVFQDYVHYSPEISPMIWSWLLGESSRAWVR